MAVATNATLLNGLMVFVTGITRFSVWKNSRNSFGFSKVRWQNWLTKLKNKMKNHKSKTQICPSHKKLITAAKAAKLVPFGYSETRWHRHPNGDWVSNNGEIQSSEEMNKRPLIVPTTKAGLAKHNAHQFFQDLILSLTKHKKKWTATERMQYNRVAKFLE